MRFTSVAAVAALAVATTVSASTDIDTLNYALTLEYLEAAFYNQAVQQYPNAASFGALSPLYANVQLVQGHENAHVAYLQKVITSLGGTYVQPCGSYNFSGAFATPQVFLDTAYAYETIGVGAYDGAISSLTNPALQQGAATIATIEARHADFFQQWASTTKGTKTIPAGSDANNAVLGGAFDNATDFYTVVNDVKSLLTNGSCGTDLTPLTARSAPSNYSTAYLQGTSNTLQQNDFNALNYALFLENFEAAFYAHYVGSSSAAGKFSANDFAFYDNNETLSSGTTLARLQLIGAHEAAHVKFLQTALSGHNPVAACSGSNAYTWNDNLSVADFLTTAAKIENTGVSAYDGAVNTITFPAYAQAAATIATVEARHADYLNTISGYEPEFTKDSGANDGTGGAFDTPLSPSTVANAVAGLGFIPAGCISTLSALPSTPGATSSTPKNAAGQMSVNLGSVIAAGLAAAAIMA